MPSHLAVEMSNVLSSMDDEEWVVQPEQIEAARQKALQEAMESIISLFVFYLHK